MRRQDEIQIRDAVPADAPVIAEIHVTAWQVAYAGILPDGYLTALSIEKHTAFWKLELTAGRTITMVAVHSDTIIGWISGGMCRDADAPECTEVHALYVSPDWWGGGSGKKLMRAVSSRFPSASATTLWVLEQNRRGKRFYQHLGFAADGAAKIIRIGGAELTEIRLRKEGTPQDIWERMAEP
jgi:L-amino acid N-acyltransferase YncA